MAMPQPSAEISSRQAISLAGLSVIGLAIIGITYFILHAEDAISLNQSAMLLVVTGLLTCAATRLSLDAPQRWALIVIFALALVMRYVALLDDPVLSTDLYRYIWDGRVQGADINPYRYIPADPALADLHDVWIYPEINRADYAKTIYPPVAQFFFFLVTRFNESTDFMREVLIACEAITIAVILDLLRRLGRSPVWVVAYAWHPMAIWEIGNNGHIDGLMVPLLMTAVWLLVSARRVLSGIVLALAVVVKPYVIVVSPAFWRRWDWRVPLVAVATVIACYLPYLGVGWGVFGFLGGYATEEGLTAGNAFWLVDVAHHLVATQLWLWLYLAAAAVTLGWRAFHAAFNSERSPAAIIDDIAVLLLTGIFFLSPNYPWYVLVLVPFLCLRTSPGTWTLTIGAFVLYLNWPGDWFTQKLVWKSFLYGAFVVTLVAENRLTARNPIAKKRALSWNR